MSFNKQIQQRVKKDGKRLLRESIRQLKIYQRNKKINKILKNGYL